MKNISFLLILFVYLVSCEKNINKNDPSIDVNAKNEKIRNHFVIVTGELDKFMNAEKLNKGFKFEKDYLTSLPYAIMYIKQMKSVGYTAYSDTEYQKAFSYALSNALKSPEDWKKLTYTLAAKKYGNITKYNSENNKTVDSLAYFQTGTNIISNEVYASGLEIQGFADLHKVLEKVGIEEQFRTPIDFLD